MSRERNNVAKHAHLAGRAGVHESSGKGYNRKINQLTLDLEHEEAYYTDHIEDEFIEENEDDED